MTDTTDQSTPCALADRDGPIGCDPQLLVELLNDDDARAVYLFVETPATVGDVADALELSQSTAYRKVERLCDAGLITQLNERSRSGSPAHYVQAIDRVSVTYDDPMRIECAKNGATLYCEP